MVVTAPNPSARQFGRDGAALAENVLSPDTLDDLRHLLSDADTGHPGARLRGIPGLDRILAADGPIGALAAARLDHATPVRAVLFDKNPAANWALGWHQDRTIAVRHRRDVEGYGPWSTKGGTPHVEPPMPVLDAMLSLRVHLDDAGPGNAPLLVALGSHRLGRIPVDGIAAVVRDSTVLPCLARAGDIWIYATPILHASAAATAPARRRVLQVDYAASTLPGGLEWHGL